MLNNSDYETKLRKAKEAQLRQFEKQKARQADPEFREKQFAKKKAAAERSIRKQREKQKDPEYIKKQIEKANEKKLRLSSKQKTYKPIKTKKPLKRKSMKGDSPTKDELRVANKVASLGCICCRLKGLIVPDETVAVQYVSIHHCNGRSKRIDPFALYKILPLCEYHHQVWPEKGTAPEIVFPIHGGGKAWKDVNGTEEELMRIVYKLIGEAIPWSLGATKDLGLLV